MMGLTDGRHAKYANAIVTGCRIGPMRQAVRSAHVVQPLPTVPPRHHMVQLWSYKSRRLEVQHLKNLQELRMVIDTKWLPSHI